MFFYKAASSLLLNDADDEEAYEDEVQGVHKFCVLFQEFSKVCHLFLGCYWLYNNYQPIGVTVHSHCVKSFEGSYSSDVGEGGVAVNCEKHNFS